MTEKNTEEMLTESIVQNRIIIGLLGRLVFPTDKLLIIIQKNSKKPEKILKAYNLCTGEFSIPEIAKKADIAIQSLREAINKWQKEGILMLKRNTQNRELIPIHLYEVNKCQ